MNTRKNSENIFDILERAGKGFALDLEDVMALLNAQGADYEALLKTADEVRAATVGDEIHLRCLIEISNNCVRNCLYCGLRRDNAMLPRYRMSFEEVVETAKWAADRGHKTIVLQSGEDNQLDAASVGRLVAELKKLDVAVTLSLGEYTGVEYAVMRSAGADRYLLRHETADSVLYSEIHCDSDFDSRRRCLLSLKKLGFQTGGGMMVGVPGQTNESLADDIMFLRELNVEMAGIGPFIPNDDTPMGGHAAGNIELVLRAMAVARLVIPDVLMPATTATGTIHPDGRAMALCAGANVVMPNITPEKYRNLYRLYPGKIGVADSADDSVATAEKLAASLGRPVSVDYGHSRRARLHTI